MVRRLDQGALKKEEVSKLEGLCKQARRQIIESTTLAKSGHLSGALDRAEEDAVIYYGANIVVEDPFKLGGDIAIDSAAHYSAGTYATLAQLGFFDVLESSSQFRRTGSRYEGHTNSKVPTIWLDGGILGLGTSAAMGLSLGCKLLGYDDVHITVKTGDGSWNEGQIAESLRFGAKYKIKNVTIWVDKNLNQLSGTTEEVMPMDIAEVTRAAGWKARQVPGHNIRKLWNVARKAKEEGLTVIISNTIMGKGYSKIEGSYEYHGKPLSIDDANEALKELGFEPRWDELGKKRAEAPSKDFIGRPRYAPKINPGEPILYKPGDELANRKAFGAALVSIGEANMDDIGRGKNGYSPVAVMDSDVKPSTYTNLFEKRFGKNFFQNGISEGNAASACSAMSLLPILVWNAGFGVLTVAQTYQQNRMSAINHGNEKKASTHCFPDVGEDGKSHQCIDFLAINNNPGWETFIPVDPNQTDRITRYMSTTYGCQHLVMGRSNNKVICKQEDSSVPFFGVDYEFKPGKVDVLRDYGNEVLILTYGNLAHRAVKVAEDLKGKIGIKVLNVTTPTEADIQAIKAQISSNTKGIITYEEHYIGKEGREHTGMASIMKGRLYDNEFHPPIKCMGVRDYCLSGPSKEVYDAADLLEGALTRKITDVVKPTPN